MRAVVLEEYAEPLVVKDVPAPTADPNGVVIEVEACGVCRSDWHQWQGHLGWLGETTDRGRILGHEPAGTIVEVGNRVTDFQIGDRVGVPFNIADGTCPQCRAGRSNTCENGLPIGSHIDGAFAELLHVPWADYNLVELSNDWEPADFAGLGCRFMTAFHGLVHRADVSAGDWVAVHGCGGVGLSAVHIANALGARVIATDILQEKLQQSEKLGAVETVDVSETNDVPDAIRTLTNGGADVSIDALGRAETSRNSVRSLKVDGTHVQIGLTTEAEAGMITLPTDEIVVNEIDFVGSVGMPHWGYERIFEMVAVGRLEPGAIVSETLSLDDVPETLESMSDYETMGIPVVTGFWHN